ncbi:hypothetical protein HPG69_013905, partial [Diceros bicornis minor]
AHPVPLVHTGESVALSRHSELPFDTLILLKEEEKQHSQQFVEELPDGHTQAHFSVGPMTSVHVGPTDATALSVTPPMSGRPPVTMRMRVWLAQHLFCLCPELQGGCSVEYNVIPSSAVRTQGLTRQPYSQALSDLNRIHKKPLSAQVGPMVMSGENLALFCESDSLFDKDHLSREGEAEEHWLTGRQSHNGAFQAVYPLGSVTQRIHPMAGCMGAMALSITLPGSGQLE